MADSMAEAMGPDVSILDRILPWRRRRILNQVMQRRIDRMAETVQGIKEDHGLDDLARDIESARAQGQAAMERSSHDQRKQPPPIRRRQDSQTGLR